MLWIGDFHDITVSHAEVVFGAPVNFGFMGTNVTAYRQGSRVQVNRPISNIDWTSFQRSYLEKPDKESIVVYIHEPTIFTDELHHSQLKCDKVWTWIKENVSGPVVIRMDSNRWYDGCIPTGPMAYIPYERKISVRHLVYYNRGSELDWTVGASFDPSPYVRGYNFVIRASPMFGQGMDEAVYSLISKDHGKEQIKSPQDVLKAVDRLCAETNLPIPEIQCKCVSKTMQHGEVWESRIRTGPFVTDLCTASNREESIQNAYTNLLALLNDFTVSKNQVSRGCC
nr:VP9 [Jeddah tick coltivirus]